MRRQRHWPWGAAPVSPGRTPPWQQAGSVRLLARLDVLAHEVPRAHVPESGPRRSASPRPAPEFLVGERYRQAGPGRRAARGSWGCSRGPQRPRLRQGPGTRCRVSALTGFVL